MNKYAENEDDILNKLCPTPSWCILLRHDLNVQLINVINRSEIIMTYLWHDHLRMSSSWEIKLIKAVQTRSKWRWKLHNITLCVRVYSTCLKVWQFPLSKGTILHVTNSLCAVGPSVSPTGEFRQERTQRNDEARKIIVKTDDWNATTSITITQTKQEIKGLTFWSVLISVHLDIYLYACTYWLHWPNFHL